jgi:hypothetical protein
MENGGVGATLVNVADRWAGTLWGPGHQRLGAARGSAVRRSALWSKQGRKWGAQKWAPGLQCQAAVKISFKIKFQTDLNHIQILSNFNSSKKDPPELENFQIKYVCEGFKEGNNFLHRNVLRFEMYFKIKFRGSKV